MTTPNDSTKPQGSILSRLPRRTAAVVPLTVLFNDIVDARANLAQERQRPGAATGSCSDARAQMLCALKAYTAALEGHRLPVPYALRDELRIHQRVSR